MFWSRFVLAAALVLLAASAVRSAECDTPAKEVNLDLWSTRSISSPDQKWKFQSVGPHSPDKKALLYIQNVQSSKTWPVGSIVRNGTAFWSRDSKRLFLRDEYAADDTKIRVFDMSDGTPVEIKGLDGAIQKALFAHIPKNRTTQWLYYPEVCFAADDSSMVILIADAPLIPKKESGSGVSFDLKLIVNVRTRQVVDVAHVRGKS